MVIRLSLEYFKKKFLPFILTKESGSSPSGKNKNEIFLLGCKSLIEFSAALTAALYPLASPSKHTIILSKY